MYIYKIHNRIKDKKFATKLILAKYKDAGGGSSARSHLT
jgi:hypothetical protein